MTGWRFGWVKLTDDSDDDSFCGSANEESSAVAVYQSVAKQLCFWPTYIEALPEEYACALIAHELAHCYFDAIGDEGHFQVDNTQLDIEPYTEQKADELAQE